MQIDVTGQHVSLTNSLRDYVHTKLRRLERHFDHITSAHVVLSIEKQRQRVDATLNVAGAKLVANAVSESMYAAIDGLADKLDAQIKRHKEKLTDHHRSNGGLKALDVS
ncbi:MAG: ribosome-associated translation inhibitor RaiA [Gammaproteobacteria bacterium]|nr:ribosome-associated translation inhibitor RaiA [Gammaproteobacteria bacterium]